MQNTRTLYDLYPGAFFPGIDRTAALLTVKNPEAAEALKDASSGTQLALFLEAPNPVTEEEKALLLSCLDICYAGKVRIEMNIEIAAPKAEPAEEHAAAHVSEAPPAEETAVPAPVSAKPLENEAALTAAFIKIAGEQDVGIKAMIQSAKMHWTADEVQIEAASFVLQWIKSQQKEETLRDCAAKVLNKESVKLTLKELPAVKKQVPQNQGPQMPAQGQTQIPQQAGAQGSSPTMTQENSPENYAPEGYPLWPEGEETVPQKKKEEAKPKNHVLAGKPISSFKAEIPLSQCDVERRQCLTRGIVSSFDIREIKGGKGILTIKLTDYVSFLVVKAFVVMKTYLSTTEKYLKNGETLIVKGNLQMDNYLQDLVLMASSIVLSAEPLKINEEKKQQAEAMIVGRPFYDEAISIKDALEKVKGGRVAIYGDILSFDSRELRNKRMLVTLSVTDYTDSVAVIAYMEGEEFEKKSAAFKVGKQVHVKGLLAMDEQYSHEYQITADAMESSSLALKPERKDTWPKKRVELHAHTKISEMDAVIPPKELVKQAYRWGHKAVAITDHGVVQGMPEVMDTVKSLKGEIKALYGMEAYMVDDTFEPVIRDRGQSLRDRYVVFDIETTGFSKEDDSILEIGAVKVENGQITEKFSEFVNPNRPIPAEITKLTSITDDMVAGADPIDKVLPRFLEFSKDCVLVAHNASFDTGFIENKTLKLGLEDTKPTIVDTLGLARGLMDLKRYTLDSICKHLGISLENHHRAVDDAGATAEMFVRILGMLEEAKITKLSEINDYIKDKVDPKKLRSHHAVILVQNKVGLKHLYELVTLSHLDYFNHQPKIPKSEMIKRREGLIYGSACSAGELYEAVLEGESEDTLEKIVSFYDYLEVQPIGNDRYLIDDTSHENIQSDEDLRNINRKIVALGERYHKPVCATSDAHFLNPEDEIFRKILLATKKFADADKPMPLYLRTTDEMMEEFSYLGEEKAEEVVITNTNAIADRIESILPIPDGQFSPVIEGAEEELKRVCYEKAHSMYGDPLPEIVKERLSHELECIINNGFGTLYILARRLVLHSVEAGYYVGSRGSVGSSLAATMAGITEVNPLKAHYYCPKCHYSDFDPEAARGVAGMSGFDLPEANCPKCGTPLKRDGQEIPFEVFLGFNGDKEPDIDLNFSGEYQAKAHAYVEEMFGHDHTFKAGTMSGLADKTAYGMVKHYLEERGIQKSNAEINFLVAGIKDVKKTTGQHPGGIIVVPQEYDVCDFTPVQHPANDPNTPIRTTHYDYDQLHGRLLKLDILGHDDPTMIRMLEDMTHTNAQEVPVNDPGVMSLFLGTEALGVTPEQIGSPVGTFGISEFGTPFVRQMLVDTKPKSFSELVRISGLSHGTDVWNNNAKDIVAAGIAPISECICTREDIMVDLIHLGMDKLLAFKIMEIVRKGKKSGGLKPEHIEKMIAAGIEPWYLESCKKIQYLFPKGHAVAYVTMSLRIAYYKVHYKEFYYAAYFTIRADGFDYETMAMGEAKARAAKEALEKQEKMSDKDKSNHTLYELVVEAYARGIQFLPMDLYKSDAHKFQVIDGKLLPPFDTISGMGLSAAQSIVEARKDGEFLTQEDFIARTKVSRTNTALMKELGILGDMPETDQLSLF